MKKILGIGNALVDIMTILPNENFLTENNLPKGSMQLVDSEISAKLCKAASNMKQSISSGGSAANTIHGIAALGVPAGYLGKVNKDEMGKFFESDMTQNGIDAHLLKGNNPSGVALALITPDSERTFATCLGAAVELSPDDISSEIIKKYDIAHIEGYLVFNNELVTKAVKTAKECGLTVSIDLASYNVVDLNRDFLKELVKNYVDIVFANEEEAKSFTGKEPREALDEIAKICDIAIVKVGSKGSYIKKGNQIIEINPIKVNAVDTTGAGDLFASGFLSGYAQGLELKKCGDMGSLLAGKVIEVIGSKMPENTWNEIREKIKLIKND